MGYISHIDGSYYEGDKQYGDSIVPNRPSADYQWINSAWAFSPKIDPITNYKAMIRRRATTLTPINAVLLLKSIGE